MREGREKERCGDVKIRWFGRDETEGERKKSTGRKGGLAKGESQGEDSEREKEKYGNVKIRWFEKDEKGEKGKEEDREKRGRKEKGRNMKTVIRKRKIKGRDRIRKRDGAAGRVEK